MFNSILRNILKIKPKIISTMELLKFYKSNRNHIHLTRRLQKINLTMEKIRKNTELDVANRSN